MDNKFLGQQETYPSPTAAQTGTGVSPYQQNHQDPNDEALDLNAQLQTATQHHDAHASMAGQAYNTAMNAQQLSQPQSNYGYPPAASVSYNTGPLQGISGPSPQTPDDSARKKTKVTRACDECRRKKIKCDASSDAPGAPKCSNCVRTNAECKFSRAPQKRGPSKGYIKELSDRVAQLEGNNRSSTSFDDSPSVLGNLGSDRKRAYSMTLDNSYDQDPAFPPTHIARSFAPAQISDQHIPIASSRAKSLGIELAIPETGANFPLRPLLPVDERNMADLSGIVNRTIPMFGSSDGINSNLAFCTPALRSAFYYAVGAVVGSPEGGNNEQSRENCAKHVFHLMHGGELAEDTDAGRWEARPYQANLVYLQTLLLCVLYHQSSGPIQPQPWGNFTCSQLLEQSRRMVDHLKLRFVTEPGHLGTAGDPNRVFSMARKTFWVFVILDAWHSIGTRASRQMPYFSAGTEFTARDKEIFNDTSFIEFANRSLFTGSMADRLRTVMSNSPAVVDAGLDTFQSLHLCFGDGSVPQPTSIDGSTNPFAGLAFATTDLLCAMLYAGPDAVAATPQIVEAGCRVGTLLLGTKVPDQGLPLTHHFVIPAVKALLRAADSGKQRSMALAGLRDILTAVHNNAILENSKWQNEVIRAIEVTLNDDKGMRGLATAAAGELGENGMGGGLDQVEQTYQWPSIVINGYLNGDLLPRRSPF